MNDSPIAFLNGELIPSAEAKLPVCDTGIVLGATVTEMIRTFGQQPYRLEDHVDWLCSSMRYAQFHPSLSRDEMIAKTPSTITPCCRRPRNWPSSSS